MNNKQKKESIVLAHFLGWEISKNAKKLKLSINELPFGYNKLRLKDLKFHESYDWLMLIVDKIDELGYNTMIESYDTGTHINRVILISSNDSVAFKDIRYEGDNKSKLLLKACLKFVERYNINASTSGLTY